MSSQGKIIAQLFELPKDSVMPQEKDLRRVWSFDESIFDDRLYLDFIQTGTLRSPIDITGLVIKEYFGEHRSVMLPIKHDKNYIVSVEVKNSTLFKQPTLSYVLLKYIGNPYLSSTDFLDVFGPLNEVRNITVSDNFGTRKIVFNIAPSGSFYISTSPTENNIVIPWIEFIQEKIIEQGVALPSEKLSNIIFNYDFVFFVYPTGWALYRYFKDIYDDITWINKKKDDLLSLKHFFNTFILEYIKSIQIEDKNIGHEKLSLENLKKKLTVINFIKVLKLLDNKTLEVFNTDKKRVDKLYEDMENYDKTIGGYILSEGLFDFLDNELKLSFEVSYVPSPLVEFLQEIYINIPIHFKIDPLAKITSSGA